MNLYSLDISIFYFINTTLQNRVFDVIMPFLTDLNKNRPVLVLIGLLLVWMIVRGGKNVRLPAIMLILTIIASDQLNSSVIKFILERPRPCHVLSGIHLLVDCGSGYAFPSSHAVNNFAAAVVLSYFIPRGWWAFFSFAALVAFSRVYVGVHYPSDVLGGAVIGAFLGALMIALFHVVEYSWMRIRKKPAKGG
ncbi:MAG: phosphatase PAP2 family protein [Bacteroidota bacterium]